MIRLTLMRWLLTNLIAIGLVLAPLNGPLSSSAMAHEMMAHEMMAHETVTHETVARGTSMGMLDMSPTTMTKSATIMTNMSMMADMSDVTSDITSEDITSEDMTSEDIASKGMASKDVTSKGLISDMAAEMPCCPDTQKGQGCQDCPFSAICMMKISAAPPASAEGLPVRFAKLEMFIAADDIIAAGMNRPPPDQPPRILA